MDQIKKFVKDTILAKSIVDEIEEINSLNNKEIILRKRKLEREMKRETLATLCTFIATVLMFLKLLKSSLENSAFYLGWNSTFGTLFIVMFFISMNDIIDFFNKAYISQCSFLELDEEKLNYINDFLKNKSKTDDYILDIEKEENILYIDINDRKIILNEYFDYLDIPVNDYKKYKFVRFWFYEIFPQKTVIEEEIFNGNYELKIDYGFEIRKGE